MNARLIAAVISLCTIGMTANASEATHQTKGEFDDRFRQLDEHLPTPNNYRTASGAPGHEYWQQRADYDINVVLDEKARRITGTETITYTNRSPDSLKYLWLQLDQNRFKEDSLDIRSRTAEQPVAATDFATSNPNQDVLSYGTLAFHQDIRKGEYGYDISKVTDAGGRTLKTTVVDTLMRIDLPTPLKPGAQTKVTINWSFNILNEPRVGSRGGYEYFEDSDTTIFFLAQWFPRLVVYSDYEGWHNKPFLGRGEFTLEFGDYNVAITVPADHIVSSTGELTNASSVLTSEQRRRLDRAKDADAPVFIVTPEEAADNEANKTSQLKTWKFSAKNVRDFAWSSSRKFIWDAMGHKQPGTEQPLVMAMSFYPKEAEPIWSAYSTHSVIHTMEVYSRFSFAYPYPTAQSVNTWVSGGMEYPMITFNGYRPTPFEAPEDAEDGTDYPPNTWPRRVKYGLIGVIIHEIGHIYFPMIVNSDERQWTWMDEGLNTFLEYVAELEWEENYPAFRHHTNVLDYITEYMASENQVPIMTQSDSILQFGPNAYSKPAAALTVLRETVMGRELFDFAFREFSQRWQFKRPTPADFFRTMEDASGVDLDWFWRGWFYSTDHVDLAIADVRAYKIASGDPEIDFPANKALEQQQVPETLAQQRNREDGVTLRVDRYPSLKDFYSNNDRFTVSNADRNAAMEARDGLEDWERRALDQALKDDQFVYFIDFENIGGLVMPIPLQIEYTNGTQAMMMLPAEIWRRNPEAVKKMLISDKQIKRIVLDARHELPDTDRSNNAFPSEIRESRLALFKRDRSERDLLSDRLQPLRESKGQPESGGQVPLQPSN
ncbi:MAG: M1 family metallopeptidase [Pseudomonadota bacterium]